MKNFRISIVDSTENGKYRSHWKPQYRKSEKGAQQVADRYQEAAQRRVTGSSRFYISRITVEQITPEYKLISTYEHKE